MNKIEDYNFNQNDWAHFHDVILDATWDNGKIMLSQEEMEKLFLELPEDMRTDANKYGMNDTPWRERLSEWYKYNKIQKID